MGWMGWWYQLTNVANLKYRSNIKSLKHFLFSASRETPLVSGSRRRTKTSRRGCCAMLCALYDPPHTVKQQCLAINQPELVHEAPTRATTQKSMYMPQFHVIASLGDLITPYSWGVSDTLTTSYCPEICSIHVKQFLFVKKDLRQIGGH